MLVCFHILSAMAFLIMPDCLANNIQVGTGYCLMPPQQLEMCLVRTPGRAMLSSEHVLRQTHTPWPPSLLHCPQPSLRRHCQPTNLICKSCHRGQVLPHERHENCLAAFHLSHRTAFSLRCTQTLVMHDKLTLQSCLVFLLKFLMQNTVYVRNALIQYGKSYVLSLSSVVNGVQNTDFFLGMSISTHCLWYNTVAALVYLKASCF